jgi:UDP-2,3-diacylglucosamine pyrophosphatase LpxH
MQTKITRREFLGTAALGVSALAVSPLAGALLEKNSFSFVLLGDLHFDRMEHHDMEWLRTNKPDDVRQVQDYSAITRDVTPKLFTKIRDVISDSGKPGQRNVKFVLQVGDLVEGLCGTEALAMKQNSEAIAFVEQSQLGVPFVFTKGNHDITGDGAVDAFKNVLQPFMAKQATSVDARTSLSKSCHSFRCGNALFCCFDAYDNQSLAWLEATLAKRTERHCFVIIHPPVVPYGARSTWHLFARPNQKAQREKLLTILAKQNAIVLGGHIHKYNTLVREVPGSGRFLQLAVSSIIRSPTVVPKDVLSAKDYDPDQIKVEPKFSPATEEERRAIYIAEAPFVKQFQYADVPGYAIVHVNDDKVEASVFAGAIGDPWRTVKVSELLKV